MLLTVPQEEESYDSRLLTGNHFLSFPEIIPRSGALDSINVLHRSTSALLEFCGSAEKPLLEPFCREEGRELHFSGRLSWRYRHYWEPCFTVRSEGRQLAGNIVAPPGYRGAVYILSFTNLGQDARAVELGWRGTWGNLYRTVFTRKPLPPGSGRVYFDRWTESLVLEGGLETPLAALAFSSSGAGRWRYVPSPDGSFCAFSLTATLHVPAGNSRSLALYIGANREGDGAGTVLVDLKRRGWQELQAENRRWLHEHMLVLNGAAPRMEGLLNRNLFFNYFYALGRALDTEELLSLTSRSPRYYVSAAFWSRDALLWSFPGLLLVDYAAARELLVGIFARHAGRAGEHAHYLNGTLLYPGFELDQLAAFILGLKYYLGFSADFTLLGEEAVLKGLKEVAQKLLSRRDPRSGLYRTFLDPSDDPVTYPFLTYDNALAWCSLQFLAGLQRKYLKGVELGGSANDLIAAAEALKEALYRHCVVRGPGGPMFAWAVDGRGGYTLYDNPPGSLQLLAYYGFCRPEDQVYRNTAAWIRSRHNPYFNHDAVFAEGGSRHAANPWPLAAANDLLSQNRGALDFLERASMDSGFCCETVFPHSGIAATGLAFASGAGFLAYALWYRLVHKALGTPERA